MEQRTMDLKGLIGQVRGFNLEEFLGDWEDPGTAVPWAYGDNTWVKEDTSVQPSGARTAEVPPAGAGVDLAKLMTIAGVSPKVKILYVPDYIPMKRRVLVTETLFRELSRALPSFQVDLALAEGPFEDDDGVGAHFDEAALRAKAKYKKKLALKVDFHSSVVKLARHAAMHKPAIIIGEGQGALIAVGYAKPLLLEAALATRNIQPEELSEIRDAWGETRVVVIHDPKVHKTSVREDELKESTPELFDTTFPIPMLKTFSWKDTKVTLYQEGKQLMDLMGIGVVDMFQDIPFARLLEEPSVLMWEHQGKCPCGKKAYLFNQCPKCVREEQAVKRQQEQETAEDLAEAERQRLKDNPEPLEEPTSGVAPLRLPNQLIRLPLKSGRETRDVILITDSDLLAIAKGRTSWKHGPAFVKEWRYEESFKLCNKLFREEGRPFRIAFAVTDAGDLLPIQQCVDTQWETSHEILAEAWYRDEALLAGVYEMTSAAEQLTIYAAYG